MRKRVCFALVAVLAGWVAGCQSSAPRGGASAKPALSLSARPAPGPGLTVAEIGRGAKLCRDKCVRCHQLYDPSAYSDTTWSTWMTKMSRKAHLKAEEMELLRRYFEGFRGPARTTQD